jgi:predicted MFS family arabinose efflux permease
MAGRAVGRWGTRGPMLVALAGCVAALPMIAAPSLAWVLAGLAVMGVGTFFAQAIATGYVGRTAASDRAAASGLYLASYYLGGLAGAAMLGQVYDRLGWTPTVAALGLALGAVMLTASRLTA